MKKVGIAAFTDAGRALADRITEAYDGHVQFIRYESGLKDWCACCFAQAHGLIFIGACGIAVRTIAPFLKSKTSDPAVLVIDEKGQYVISLLSGHIGGANEFAEDVAELIGAVPVVTTASDVNGLIAVDVFAKKNHLAIASMKADRSRAPSERSCRDRVLRRAFGGSAERTYAPTEVERHCSGKQRPRSSGAGDEASDLDFRESARRKGACILFRSGRRMCASSHTAFRDARDRLQKRKAV